MYLAEHSARWIVPEKNGLSSPGLCSATFSRMSSRIFLCDILLYFSKRINYRATLCPWVTLMLKSGQGSHNILAESESKLPVMGQRVCTKREKIKSTWWVACNEIACWKRTPCSPDQIHLSSTSRKKIFRGKDPYSSFSLESTIKSP